MNFTVLWRRIGFGFDRDVLRLKFDQTYWSANRVNFDPVQMPQFRSGKFSGTVAILQFTDDCEFPDLPYIGDWELAGVVDALHFGESFPHVIREYKEVLAIGSLGPVEGAPFCDVRRFCPSLFVHTDEPEASVSFGIERLGLRGDKLVIPKDQKILVTKPA